LPSAQRIRRSYSRDTMMARLDGRACFSFIRAVMISY
jgi:hypothetical protein